MLGSFMGVAEYQFLISLAIAIVLGFVLGAERESRGKDAGISTHILVVMGAMLFTFLSGIVDSAEPSHIAAQIVTGIGFLGAGIILRDGTSVRNLTTAASLWVSAAIGMAIGFGFFAVAVIACGAAVLVPRIPHLHAKHDDA